jgi:hypothetical protein
MAIDENNNLNRQDAKSPSLSSSTVMAGLVPAIHVFV